MALPIVTKGMGWVRDLPALEEKLFTDLFYDLSKFPVRGWFHWKKPSYPDFVDLYQSSKGRFPPIFDQGYIESCIPNACARMLAFIESMEIPGDAPLLSRLFLYYYGRLFKSSDSGSSVRLVLTMIEFMGVPLESLWPYDPTKVTIEPSSEAKEDAIKRKKVQYARIETLDGMLNCLAQGYPFVFGISLFNSFQTVTDINGDAWIQMPSKGDPFLGGHGLLATGYDLKKKAIIVDNSWGEKWGKGGRALLPFSYITSPICDDMWSCRYIATP